MLGLTREGKGIKRDLRLTRKQLRKRAQILELVRSDSKKDKGDILAYKEFCKKAQTFREGRG
jgi:hypothetical protein